MVRPPTTNAALRAATRERLLQAALQVFAARGYADVTVRDIAAQAGVAVGALYQHFDGKDALLAACFARSMDQVRATFAEAMAGPADDRLGTLARAAAATVRAHLPFWQLGYAARHQPAVVAALGPALSTWTDEIVTVLAALLRETDVRDPAMAALVLFAQIDGVCVHYALAPDTYPLDAVVDHLVTTLPRPSRPR